MKNGKEVVFSIFNMFSLFNVFCVFQYERGRGLETVPAMISQTLTLTDSRRQKNPTMLTYPTPRTSGSNSDLPKR